MMPRGHMMFAALQQGVKGKQLQAVALIEKMDLTLEQTKLLDQLLGVLMEMGKESEPHAQEGPAHDTYSLPIAAPQGDATPETGK